MDILIILNYVPFAIATALWYYNSTVLSGGTYMKRLKPVTIWIFLLLLCAALQIAAAAADSLLVNTDFATSELPEGWSVVAYEPGGCSVVTQDDALVITSAAENDVRVCQMVQVKPGTVYRLSAEISAEGVHGGRGVCLAVDNYTLDGTHAVSGGRTGSFDWITETLIFQTGEEQSYVNIALRLGSYSETSAGTAFFRSPELVESTDAQDAAGAVVLSGSLQAPAQNSSESDEARTIRLKSYLHLFIVCAVVLACVLLWGFYRNRERFYSLLVDRKSARRCFLLIVLTGAALRLILSLLTGGHDYDMPCWQAWGRDIVQNGTAQFYTAAGHEWYDYPPGYMLVLAAVTWLLDLLHISAESAAGVFVYMLPAYLADVGIAALLMRFARKHGFSESACLFLAALAVFNPAAVILSGAWGQIDSILTLLLLLSFSELTECRRISAGVIYGLAIMTKWQALIYGPVLAAEYLLSIRKKEDIVRTAGGVAAALLVILALSLPFRGNQGLFWVVERFINSAGGYDYASVEAYNFLALCGGNWKSAELSLVPGISYKAFGTAAVVLAVALSIGMQVFARRNAPGETLRERPERLYVPAAFCMFMIFTFGHYMHERYVFPVMVLLLFAYVCTKEKRFLASSMLLSVVLALNETTAMYVVARRVTEAVRGTQQHQILIAVCSLFEVLAFLYAARVCLGCDFLRKDRR